MTDLSPILELIRTYRSQSRVIGALNLAGGAAGLAWALLASGSNGDAGVLGIFFVGYGIVRLLSNLGPAENDKAYLLLSKAPERIVWAYVKEVRKQKTNTLSARSVILGAEDGKRVTIAAPSLEDARRVMELVAHVAPRASLGFDHERERQYRKTPGSLRVAGAHAGAPSP